jgi:hypothetical protein
MTEQKKIDNLREKLSLAIQEKHDALDKYFLAKSDLVSALIEQGENRYAAMGIVKGSRVNNVFYNWKLNTRSGIYIGFGKQSETSVAPVVMVETKSGVAHKTARVRGVDVDWRLADD